MSRLLRERHHAVRPADDTKERHDATHRFLERGWQLVDGRCRPVRHTRPYTCEMVYDFDDASVVLIKTL